jgi:hypothetical protein
MEKANENLSVARTLIATGYYRHAVSESYYAVFTAMRSMLAVLHLDSKRHEGVMTLFHQHFFHTGRFPKDFNKLIPKLKKMREDATYAPKIVVTEEEAQAELDEADKFLHAAEIVLARMLSEKL